MSETTLAMEHVSKRFRRGAVTADSLRDLIPELVLGIVRKGNGSLKRKEFWALDDVSFQVKRGEAFGIIGPNGAGKSTILKIMSGVMEPTKGNLEVHGRLAALIEIGAGFHPDLTGRENIFLSGSILGMKRAEIKRAFDDIVDFSGISEFIDTPVKRYSSGMYARLGFSVAAHVNPDIMLVDEVLSVGDYLFQEKCLAKMHDIVKGGTSVIFVSHRLKSVSEMCGSAMCLERGKMIALGPTDAVIAAYLGLAAPGEARTKGKEVFVSSVRVNDDSGRSATFRAGQKIRVEIEIQARKDCEKLSVTVLVEDSSRYHVFDTATERLGHPAFDIRAGETLRFTFELDLNLAPGAYYLGAQVYRYDIEHMYDRCMPATTIYVSADVDVRGVAYLNPRLIVHAECVRTEPETPG